MENNAKFIFLTNMLKKINVPMVVYVIFALKTVLFGTSWEEVGSLTVASAVYVVYKFLDFKIAKIINEDLESVKTDMSLIKQVVNQSGIANIMRSPNEQTNKKRHF